MASVEFCRELTPPRRSTNSSNVFGARRSGVHFLNDRGCASGQRMTPAWSRPPSGASRSSATWRKRARSPVRTPRSTGRHGEVPGAEPPAPGPHCRNSWNLSVLGWPDLHVDAERDGRRLTFVSESLAARRRDNSRGASLRVGYPARVSWAVWARRVRDPGLPLRHRSSALRSLLNHHAPLGFDGTERHLRQLVGVTDHGGRLGARRADDWTETTILAALEALEASRESRLRFTTVFAERRRREKAQHRRQPTLGDSEALRRAEWLKDVDEAAQRQPSRREIRRARG